MHWAEKEVASLELSKKLKELGFPKNREGWYWVKTTYPVEWILAIMLDGIWLSVKNYIVIKDEVIEEIIKAPTCPEIDKWLPLYLKKDAEKGIAFNVEVYGLHLYRTYDNKGWCITYGTLGRCASTLPNAFAEMLICLVENGYITFNQGDQNDA